MLFLLSTDISAAAVTTPLRIAAVNLPSAITQTAEGRRLRQAVQASISQLTEKLRKARSDLDALRAKLEATGDLLNAQAHDDLLSRIEAAERKLSRDSADANREATQTEQEALQKVSRPMLALIREYAKEHGYSLVVNSASPAGSVVWASNVVDITPDIVHSYDRLHPAGAGTKGSAKP